MKQGKLRYVLMVILLLLSATLFGGDKAELWTKIFRRSQSLEQQKAILINILKLNDRDLAPLLDEALGNYVRNLEKDTNYTEKKLRIEVTKMVVKELGDLKAGESAELVMDVFRFYEDPFVRGEALIALGKMRSTKYAEEITLFLRNLNFGPEGEPREREILAFGAIISLGYMKSTLSYETMYYASRGWYPKRTRDRAETVLDSLSEDPSDFLSEVMKNAGYQEKRYALAKALASQAPANRKADLSLQALQDGLKNEPSDLTEQLQLNKLRLLAIEGLNEHGKNRKDAVSYLKETVTRKWEQNERLSAIVALGLNGTEEAAKVLAEFLNNFNYRQIEGLNTQEDIQACRATIGAIGLIKTNVTIEALIEVEFSNWPPNMIRLAKETMEKIQ